MTLTFNQIQFRVFLFVFLLFAGGALGYRYFIELPKLNQSFTAIIEKELTTLKFSIQEELNGLAISNYDYAVWNATYNYMQNKNPTFFEENIVENTFSGLKVDGMFFIGKDFELYSGHEIGDLSGKSLTYSFFDFNKYPENLLMLPKAVTNTGAPKKLGFIRTSNGPAMYSTTQIRNSNMGGENQGYLIMIRLLNKEFVEKLSRYTSTVVSFQPLSIKPVNRAVFLWDDKHIINDYRSLNYVQINDFKGDAVTFLSVHNGITEQTNLLSREIIQFFIITLVLLLIAYQLISNKIIKPVKGFAIQIKKIDIENGLILLDENHEVQELNTVSNHFNQLAMTIKDQTERLAHQVTTDPLTQILNRRGLIDSLELYKEQCIRHNIGFIIVMCDIDHFKLYNDTLGHIAGDDALFRVAQTLNNQCLRGG